MSADNLLLELGKGNLEVVRVAHYIS